MGLFIPYFYITSYATSIGKDPDMSFYLVSILNGASLLGRILPSILADRYGVFNMITIATFFSGIGCCCMTSATTMAGLIAIAAAYGLASGAIISLQGACSTRLVRPETYGAAMGSLMAVCSLAYVLRPASRIACLLFSHVVV
jgi:MFS family permease